jgi:hypothetical protein
MRKITVNRGNRKPLMYLFSFLGISYFIGALLLFYKNEIPSLRNIRIGHATWNSPWVFLLISAILLVLAYNLNKQIRKDRKKKK